MSTGYRTRLGQPPDTVRSMEHLSPENGLRQATRAAAESVNRVLAGILQTLQISPEMLGYADRDELSGVFIAAFVPQWVREGWNSATESDDGTRDAQLVILLTQALRSMLDVRRYVAGVLAVTASRSGGLDDVHFDNGALSVNGVRPDMVNAVMRTIKGRIFDLPLAQSGTVLTSREDILGEMRKAAQS